MSPRRLLLVIVVLLGIAAFFYRGWSPQPQVSAVVPAPVLITAPLPQPSAATTPAGPLPPWPEGVANTWELESGQVIDLISAYRRGHDGNPVGSNAEITQHLLDSGDPQQPIPLPTGLRTNDHGELCDHWGTPYFFHQQSGTEMEVRSAGPDRKFWTDDDREAK